MAWHKAASFCMLKVKLSYCSNYECHKDFVQILRFTSARHCFYMILMNAWVNPGQLWQRRVAYDARPKTANCQAFMRCQELGEEVVNLIDEKKRWAYTACTARTACTGSIHGVTGLSSCPFSSTSVLYQRLSIQRCLDLSARKDNATSQNQDCLRKGSNGIKWDQMGSNRQHLSAGASGCFATDSAAVLARLKGAEMVSSQTEPGLSSCLGGNCRGEPQSCKAKWSRWSRCFGQQLWRLDLAFRKMRVRLHDASAAQTREKEMSK